MSKQEFNAWVGALILLSIALGVSATLTIIEIRTPEPSDVSIQVETECP